MIRERRQAHARTFGALAVLVPVFLAVGVWQRPDMPRTNWSDRLAAEADFGSADDRAPNTLSAGGHNFEFQIEADDESRPALLIRPTAIILKPDLLVYWVQDASAEVLPADAILLGRLSGTSTRRLALPAAALEAGGAVIIYSLGHQEVAARLPLQQVASGIGGTTG